MRILFDINHPAHVHFFRYPIQFLRQNGHEVLITSRTKDVTLSLLNEFDLPHVPLSTHRGGGIVAAMAELVERDLKLLRVVRREKPNVMVSIGGTFIAHVGALTGIPALVFYDTENARLQNAITYPLASRVYVPRCYTAWVPKRRTTYYPGYHELSYLHPERFKPDIERALAAGLSATGDTFLLRIVSWQANHDIGEKGWSAGLLRLVIQKLAPLGRVLISSEAKLGEEFREFRYSGPSSDMHHVLAHCRLCVGESATVASESAILGVPAIYVAETGRGYTDEQEQRYGLVRNLRHLDWGVLEAAIDDFLSRDLLHWQERRQQLLNETLDVSVMVAEVIQSYPELPLMLQSEA